MVTQNLVDFEGIMFIEKSHSQNIDYYDMIPFLQHSQNDKTTEMENRLVVSGDGPGKGCSIKAHSFEASVT